MIDIPIAEKPCDSTGTASKTIYKSNDDIYLGGHTAQIEYKKNDVFLLSTIYGPHICTQFFKKDSERCVIDVKCKFPASSRDDPIEEELQNQLKNLLEGCIKGKNYPGCIITVIIDICSVHSELAKLSLLSHCFNSVMYCFNRAGVALKVNSFALTYSIQEKEEDSEFIVHPTDSEIEEADSVLTIITNPFDKADNILEIIPHKGFFDFAIICSDTFIKSSVKEQCKKYTASSLLQALE
ncbi:unnamed protein product [Moneuplotes crassus]|uniref:Uncharacterized protein n=1 Tax=Euplotes crassus TaxID=5936 RepID=A0AAD1XVF0_EUPCR|nr:unnamed protein product [Moneuplotes crassus]